MEDLFVTCDMVVNSAATASLFCLSGHFFWSYTSRAGSSEMNFWTIAGAERLFNCTFRNDLACLLTSSEHPSISQCDTNSVAP